MFTAISEGPQLNFIPHIVNNQQNWATQFV
jgi:hypothetical protein